MEAESLVAREPPERRLVRIDQIRRVNDPILFQQPRGMIVAMRSPLEAVQFNGEPFKIEAATRPCENARRPRERAVRQVHRIAGLRAGDDFEVDLLISRRRHVFGDIANVVGMVVRIDRRDDSLVSNRPDRLHHVVVHTLERVEDQYTTLTDVEDGPVVERLNPPRALRQALQDVRLRHVAA